MSGNTKLLIVESPAKAKTIAHYLGAGYVVKSSVGHIRDLPRGDGAIKLKGDDNSGWSFSPTYEIPDAKKKVVSELKRAVKSASEILLASDPDREGEAIAWHLHQVLAPDAGDKPFRRVTYNEITKSAVLKAVASPRDVDMPLVDAQQARRILDRLVGYKVSPLLWKNIACTNSRTLSAGRVQSVALRLLVERQREIDAFKPETYYLIGVEAKKLTGEGPFVAKLARLDGEKPNVRNRQQADNVLLDLADATLEVAEIKCQPKVRHALPPFTTSTLQQAASSVLGFSPGVAMKLAQTLYEQGRITYMRTDSVNVSEQARAAAKDFIVANYGADFYPPKANFFKSKESAQGAHEAIRPTDIGLTPALAKTLDAKALKLYDLIWRRFVASQMADAKTVVKTVSIKPVKSILAHAYLFTASATEIEFEGFLKVMKLSVKRKAKDESEDEDSDEVAKLPELQVGESLIAHRWLADEKATKGPSCYSEASLIKALEDNGVGRPSTYAATIETLKAREYAKTEKRKLIPLERGVLVCDWLVKKLDALFNVGYTAEMEAKLDRVESGEVSMNAMLSEFYVKFRAAVAACATPPPDRSKFEAIFAMLDEVKEWKPPKKAGKRVYDDKAFVDSVREQFDKGERALSLRQLEYLARMVLAYENQIFAASRRLKELGLAGNAVVRGEKADPEVVKWCFSVMDRIVGLEKDRFLVSLREQVDHNRGLSPKQLSILAKAIGDNASRLPDCEEVRQKLQPYCAAGFTSITNDVMIPEILRIMKGVTEWREVVKRGRKVYDDKAFVESLTNQYSRRHSLSSRQAVALRRLARLYESQLPELKERADELGLRDEESGNSNNGENNE